MFNNYIKQNFDTIFKIQYIRESLNNFKYTSIVVSCCHWKHGYIWRVMYMDAFRVFVNELFKKKIDTIFKKNIKICKKKLFTFLVKIF